MRLRAEQLYRETEKERELVVNCSKIINKLYITICGQGLASSFSHPPLHTPFELICALAETENCICVCACVCVCAGKINWNANAAASKVLQFHCILSGGHKLNMAAPKSVCVCVCAYSSAQLQN